MLPSERRLPEVRGLIEQGFYFVIHAPRQTGKTTFVRALAQDLTGGGSFAAVATTCETGQPSRADLELGVSSVIETLLQDARTDLPAELRPPVADRQLEPTTRLRDLLIRWAETSPLPVVLFLDEIDSLLDETLLTVLRQLRSGYPKKPRHFPHSVALIGLRDVRDYRASDDGDTQLGTASPFNVKVRSFVLADFTAEEVAELYRQHTEATGQRWSGEAIALAFELTQGQPWLVNALANQIVTEQVVDRQTEIRAEHVFKAKDVLIQRRDTHLDSLAHRLREPRVQKVLSPILAGEVLEADVMFDDVQWVIDLGLVRQGSGGLEIANPIYREIVPRILTHMLESSLELPRPSYIDRRGRLDFALLLEDFRAFWRANGETFLSSAPYPEAAAQLVFMAFLHKIVNGGGQVEREYAAGRGRLDLLVRWPHPGGVDRHAMELKAWRDGRPDPTEEGLFQLCRYLDRLSLSAGTLIVFDQRRLPRAELSPPVRKIELDGYQLTVLHLA
jgi:hypothetical protein